VVSNTVVGDCHSDQCDGNGNLTTNAIDNSDVPVDRKQCTNDLCTAGVPSNPDLAAGAPCNESGGTMCDGNGACVQCILASDCGLGNACRTWSCTAGICAAQDKAAGFVVGNTPAGDCHTDQCDGNGNVLLNVIDNSDKPVDGKQCTSDVCTAGVPSNPNLAAGAPCNESGGTMCDGNGACVQCILATDCPGSDTLCHARTCTASTCGVAFTPIGVPVGTQVAGDCQLVECDGLGTQVSVPDNTDVPVDNNDCTGDVCSAGVPSNPALPMGTICSQSGGTMCDGAGACVQCVLGTDCQGSDTDCQTRTCTVGVCGVAFAATGHATGTQTAGDCQQNQCDGAGNVVSVVDNTDVPVDGKDCTSDVCTAGVPSNPALPAGTACNSGGGTICNGIGTCGVPPAVVSTNPSDGGTALASTPISVTFSKAMNPATLTGQTTAGACTGSVQVSVDNFTTCIAFSAAAATMTTGNTVATFTAVPGLLVNRTYKIRVTTAVADALGFPMVAQYTSTTGFTTTNPFQYNGGVVISQVYGGGGNSSAPYKNDFIELHNRSTTAVSVAGWSVQYASAAGTTWPTTALAGTIQPGAYYLVQEASGGTIGAALPAADATGGINLSATVGKVALVSSVTALSGSCPSGGTIVDMVGFGATASCFETAVTAAPSNTTAVLRTFGCTDTNNNSIDFIVGAPTPRNSTSPVFICAPAQNESGAMLEADYCDTQFPLSLSVTAGTPTGLIYGQIYESGWTGNGSANAGITAQLGYGPATANPEYEPGWIWQTAAFHNSQGNNDEYQLSITAPAAGTYRFVYRFSLDAGKSWTYCDNHQGDMGSGSNPGLNFDLADEAVFITN
jgi:hypothetical protein